LPPIKIAIVEKEQKREKEITPTYLPFNKAFPHP
jgi:hypothetical protein